MRNSPINKKLDLLGFPERVGRELSGKEQSSLVVAGQSHSFSHCTVAILWKVTVFPMCVSVCLERIYTFILFDFIPPQGEIHFHSTAQDNQKHIGKSTTPHSNSNVTITVKNDRQAVHTHTRFCEACGLPRLWLQVASFPNQKTSPFSPQCSMCPVPGAGHCGTSRWWSGCVMSCAVEIAMRATVLLFGVVRLSLGRPIGPGRCVAPQPGAVVVVVSFILVIWNVLDLV